MPRTCTGIDVGTTSVKLLRGQVKGTGFAVTDFAIVRNAGDDVVSGWASFEPPFRLGTSRIGLTGREVNVRYIRVPRVPDWQLRKLMRFEAEEVAGSSDSPLASDFNVLPEMAEVEGEDVVLLCMARESLLAQHVAGLTQKRGKLDALTPNSIALYNAYLRFGAVMEDTVLVANIGHVNTDVILVRGPDLLFARNLGGGSQLFDEALADRFDVPADRAAVFKHEHGTLDPHAGGDANSEKAARAMLGPAGQLLSLLQSTVLFCQSQVKISGLKLDRVLLCGGGAALPGLPEYLARGLEVPVELFDPFVVVDASGLDPEAARLLERHKLESVVALGLATTGSDADAYSIEVLPEALRRRRDLRLGTSFLIAAAVLAVFYLGFFAWKKSTTLASLEVEAARLDGRFRSAQRHDQDTRALLAENEDLARFADELYAICGAGEQLARTLGAIGPALPAEFWLETMTLDWGSDDELGVERKAERPILRLRGRAREGTAAPMLAFESFVSELRTGLPETMRVKDRMNDTASYFTLDLTLFGDVEEAPEEGREDEAAEEDG